MKAVAFQTPEEGVAVKEFDKPELEEAGDALIRVTKSMICGTDLHFLHGVVDLERDFILGHEFIGVVEEVGDDVTEVSVGDTVVSSFMSVCNNCFYCRQGQYAQCFEMQLYGFGSAFGDLPGGQAEYVRIRRADTTLRVIPEDVNDEDAAFLGDIMSTAYHAIQRANFKPGQTIAVVGAGPVGLCAVQAGLAMGAAQVIALDMVPDRLKLAEENGAVAVNVKEQDGEEAVKDLTEWRGADIVIDAVGHPEALKSTIPLIRMGGQLSLPGAYVDDQVFPDWNEVYLKGITITMGIGDIQGKIDETMGLIKSGKLEPSKLISHRMPLDQAAEAYKLFDEREAFKVVLEP